MAGLISSATKEQIRAASDIVDVIGAYIPLKRAGANFVGLCPFHKEKTPSFNVSPQKQHFHCFGCGKGGDVFGFVMEYESIDFMEAVKRLADRAKIPLEYEQGGADQQTKYLKATLLEIHEQIAQRWHHCLLNEAAGQVARDYLAKRGVSAEAIKLFQIGAAPEAWDDTVNWAKSKGHDLATVEKGGLIIRKEETGNYYDRFRGRLMFPICNEQGGVIGFSGRVLSGDEKTAKYVNSPETPIFTKSKIFFGLDKSKRAILDAGLAIICEGQLDLIACFMGGVQNIVAPQGTAFTEQHARILKRYADEVVLCFDSDNAGQNAAVRALDHLLASGLAVRVAVVPAPHDPDSFIKANGGEAFRQLIEKAEGFFDYYLNRLCATNDASTDKGRLAILRGMAEAVHKTGNNVLIDTFAQKTALRLGVSVDAVRTEFKKIARGKPLAPMETTEEPQEEVAKIERPSPHEFWLLKLIFLNENLVKWVSSHLDINWIQNVSVRKIVEQRLVAHQEGKWTTLAAFLDEWDMVEIRTLITEAAMENCPVLDPEKQIVDVTTKLRNQFLDRAIKELRHARNAPGLTDTERDGLSRKEQEMMALRKADAREAIKNRPWLNRNT
ncbi:MAG TPA: DNA primase [Candidatus Polarisedimenticolia bacterium]|nr:DNA primase [Candidatus Polarisedimenticolia bacterium]